MNLRRHGAVGRELCSNDPSPIRGRVGVGLPLPLCLRLPFVATTGADADSVSGAPWRCATAIVILHASVYT